MNHVPPHIPFDELALPVEETASGEGEAWQRKKIGAGLMDADEGRFASHETVKSVIRKFVSNG